MAKKISGGIKCGAARYHGEVADVSTFRFYCRDCQQFTGAGHSEMFPLAAESFLLEGPYSGYQMTGGSGRSTWSSFC